MMTNSRHGHRWHRCRRRSKGDCVYCLKEVRGNRKASKESIEVRNHKEASNEGIVKEGIVRRLLRLPSSHLVDYLDLDLDVIKIVLRSSA